MEEDGESDQEKWEPEVAAACVPSVDKSADDRLPNGASFNKEGKGDGSGRGEFAGNHDWARTTAKVESLKAD